MGEKTLSAVQIREIRHHKSKGAQVRHLSKAYGIPVQEVREIIKSEWYGDPNRVRPIKCEFSRELANEVDKQKLYPFTFHDFKKAAFENEFKMPEIAKALKVELRIARMYRDDVKLTATRLTPLSFVEKHELLELLQDCEWNVKMTSEILGVSIQGVRGKMRFFDIDLPVNHSVWGARRS